MCGDGCYCDKQFNMLKEDKQELKAPCPNQSKLGGTKAQTYG